MEVTTVSPSPASPTEGDDLCETDVSNVIIHVLTLLLCLCGLAGNGAVLGLLRLKILISAIFYLALADFLFLLFTVPAALLFLVEDVSCSPVMSLLYVNFLFQLSAVSCYWLLFFLIVGYSALYMGKLCLFCCRCNLPKRLCWLVVSVQFWAFFALFTVIPAVTNLCPSHKQEQCRAALISIYTIILLLFAVAVVIPSISYIIKVKFGSKEEELDRREIIIFLIMLFILLLSLCNFLQQLGYTVVSSQVVFLLNCTHSSIKPFIYFLAGRCWSPCALSSLRLSLQRVFDEEEEEETDCSNDTPKTRRARSNSAPSVLC